MQVKNKPHDGVAKTCIIFDLGLAMNTTIALICQFAENVDKHFNQRSFHMAPHLKVSFHIKQEEPLKNVEPNLAHFTKIVTKMSCDSRFKLS